MNSEMDFDFIKLSNDAILPIQFNDYSDYGIQKFQLFAGSDQTIKSGHSGMISTELAVKCELGHQYFNCFQGVFELFIKLNSDTFKGFDSADNSNLHFHRIVLLTPKIHSITTEIQLPRVLNVTPSDLCINRNDLLGSLHFILRGSPNIVDQPSVSQKSVEPNQFAFCQFCNKKFTSATYLSKHLKSKHADQG